MRSGNDDSFVQEAKSEGAVCGWGIWREHHQQWDTELV